MPRCVTVKWRLTTTFASSGTCAALSPLVGTRQMPSTPRAQYKLPSAAAVYCWWLQNLAGHPFPYNVDWSSVRVIADGGRAVSPSQAEMNGDLSKTF